MRRLFAYITLAIAMLVGIIVGVPTIRNTTNAGTEFDGGNTILYHLTDTEFEEFGNNTERETKINQAIGNINDRLKSLSISNPEVDIEGDNYIRVTLPNMSDLEFIDAKYICQNNGKITVRDAQDNLLANGEDLFESLKLSATGGVVYLAAKVKDYDLLHEITHELAHEYDSSQENPQPNMFIWIGFEEQYSKDLAEEIGYAGDSYSNLETNAYCLSKLISALAVDTEITEDFSCQAVVAETAANAYNKMIAAGSFNYVLSIENISKVGSYLEEKTMDLAILALSIALVIVAALFIIVYHKAGITSALSIIACSVLVLVLYNTFGGLFGTETILALVVGLGLAVDANVVILERVKDEIKKGKTIARAFDEGSKKSVSTIIDSNIIVLIAAFALYFFGNQVVKSFAAVLIITQIAIILVVILLTRLMLSIICHSSIVAGKPGFFNVKAEEIADVNADQVPTAKNKFENVNFVKGAKKKTIIASGIVALGAVVAIVFGIITGSAYNLSSNINGGTRVHFLTIDPTMAEKANVDELLSKEEFADKKASKIVIGESSITISNDDLHEYQETFETEFNLNIDEVSRNNVKVYSVTVYYENGLSETQKDAINEYYDAKAELLKNEDEEIDILDMCFVCENFKSTSSRRALLNSFLAIGMLLAFSLVYLAIRFTFSYALSSVITVIGNELVLFAILAISRLELSSWAIAAGLSVAVLTLGNTSITFDKLRENVSEANGVIWTIETRKEYINKSLQQTMYGHLFSNISTLVASVLVFAIAGVSTMPIAIGAIIVIAAAAFGSYFVLPLLWAKFDTIFANVKANAKARRVKRQQAQKQEEKTNSKEPEEYVFFGIND